MGTQIAGTRAAVEASPYAPAVAPPPSSQLAHRPALAQRAVAAIPGQHNHQTRTERRSSRRYPIDLLVHYQPARPGQKVPAGQGRVVNMSSAGLLIQTDHILASGKRIHLRVEWPARLNDAVPLALHIEGLTVRIDRDRAAVKILRSEFRTRPMLQAAAAAHAR